MAIDTQDTTRLLNGLSIHPCQYLYIEYFYEVHEMLLLNLQMSSVHFEFHFTLLHHLSTLFWEWEFIPKTLPEYFMVLAFILVILHIMNHRLIQMEL